MGDVVALTREIEPDRVFENAVVRLLKRRPFYGHLLLNLHRRVVRTGAAVGVTLSNGTPTLIIRPDAFTSYSAAEQEALLEHVLKHLIHLHPLRGKERHALNWDVACDLAINPTIANLPAEALFPPRFKLDPGYAAEEYYSHLTSLFATGNLAGEGIGTADQDMGGHVGEGQGQKPHESGAAEDIAPLDNHAVWAEADSTPLGLGAEAVRGMVREACRHSDAELPDDVRELIETMLAPASIPWQQLLRQFVATAGRVGRKSTWKRAHRRFQHTTPGIRKRRRLNLLIGVDVSDSTAEKAVREAFAHELLQIARGRDCQLTVLYAGSRIQRIDKFSGKNAVAEVFSGGGFTDLRPVFEYAATMQPQPAGIIYLTDGYGEAPPPPTFPTLWVLTRDGQLPVDWGVELRLDV